MNSCPKKSQKIDFRNSQRSQEQSHPTISAALAKYFLVGLVPAEDSDQLRLLLFWSKCLDQFLVGFEIRTLKQINAVGNRWKDGVQTLRDCLWIAGQIQNEAASPNPRRLS